MRSRTPSFSNDAVKCALTVRSVMPMTRAISLLVEPRATDSATWRSRMLRRLRAGYCRIVAVCGQALHQAAHELRSHPQAAVFDDIGYLVQHFRQGECTAIARRTCSQGGCALLILRHI